jgi:hypothetical protein
MRYSFKKYKYFLDIYTGTYTTVPVLQLVLRIRDPGSGMGKKKKSGFGSGMNNRDNHAESATLSRTFS